MVLTRLFAGAAAVAVAIGALTVPARAAEPASGTVDATHPSVTWSGGPLLPDLFEVGCDVLAAACDSFALTVGVLDPAAGDVVVSLTTPGPIDIYRLEILDADGDVVAEAEVLGTTVTLFDPVPGAYTVRVHNVGLTPLEYDAAAMTADAGEPLPEAPPCNSAGGLEPPPPEVIEAALADDGREIFLDVLVLLDGVDPAYAAGFFETVGIPYADLSVTVVPTFQTVPAGTFTTDNALELIDAARAYLGGRVPEEYDIVEVLTDRDITAPPAGNAVAGMANCIGGLRYKEHSFEVSEAQEGVDQGGVPFGPFHPFARQAAKITAHEMGHLLGGQHHFANCVEPALSHADEQLEDTAPCTLMFNLADGVSLHFSALNGLIARGYALCYAGANDPTPTPHCDAAAAGPSGPGEPGDPSSTRGPRTSPTGPASAPGAGGASGTLARTGSDDAAVLAAGALAGAALLSRRRAR